MEEDLLHPFIFENTPIRGNLVHLNKTYTDALAHQALPNVIRQALGELMAASALLTSTLKMDGALVLQIQTNGQLKLLVVECSSDMDIRATAKWDGEIADNANFLDLIKGGQCVITLDQKDGKPYQGIVPIEGSSIAEMLESYMLRSQQLETKLKLSCDGNNANGVLLQKLPEQPSEDTDDWNRVSILADTLSSEDLKEMSVQQLITQLFHEDDVRLFDGKQVRFHCKCTREGVANMLKMVGEAEITSILDEQKIIEVNCDYCHKQYQFDRVDAMALFSDGPATGTNQSIH